MCVLQFSSQRKLFNFVYLHIKGFVLSFHQRFYEPHSNSESVQKHLNFMNGTLIPGKRFWPVAWIFCENCRQFSIRDSCTHSYCMANFVIGNFVGSNYLYLYLYLYLYRICICTCICIVWPTLLLGIFWEANISKLLRFRPTWDQSLQYLIDWFCNRQKNCSLLKISYLGRKPQQIWQVV